MCLVGVDTGVGGAEAPIPTLQIVSTLGHV